MISGIQGLCRALMPRLYLRLSSPVNSVCQRSLYTIRPDGIQNMAVNAVQKKTLLSPIETVQHKQICGLKYLAKVHRRCKDCYLMYIEGNNNENIGNN